MSGPLSTPRIDAMHGLRGIWRIFRTHGLKRQLVTMGLLLLVGLVDGFGWATMLPLVSVAVGGANVMGSKVDMMVREALNFIGLSPEIGVLLSVVVACMAVKALLMVVAMSYVGIIVAGISNELRVEMIDRLLHAKWSYFTRQPVGRFANSVGHESNRAAVAYKSAIRFLINLIESTIYIALAFLVSWKVAVLSLVVGGAISVIMHRVTRMARRAGREQTIFTERLVNRLNDVLMGVKPLKAMERHGALRRMLRKDAKRVNAAVEDIVFSQEAAVKIPDLLIILFLAASFYLAVNYWSIEVPALLVIGVLMVKVIDQLSKAQRQIQVVAISETAYFSLRRAIDEADRQREVSFGNGQPELKQGVRFDDVSFAYNTRPILRDVNIEIPAGKLTTITGPSGVGKTTIADLILGLHRPDRGNVLIDGVPIEELDLDSWRSVIGYVPQEVMLFHDSVYENVTLGDATLTEADVIEALKDAGAWQFVSELPEGMQFIVGERGGKLSGGQRQRIALARALVHKPKLLVLDEATSALDPETEAEICRNVRAQAGKTTVLAITHQPAWVTVADRVYRITEADAELMPAPQAAAATGA